MRKDIMCGIDIPDLSESDIRVLESFTEEELREGIDFFRDYRELMWIDNGTKETVSDSALKNLGARRASFVSQYPEKLTEIAEKFYRMYQYLKKAGGNGRKVTGARRFSARKCEKPRKNAKCKYCLT